MNNTTFDKMSLCTTLYHSSTTKTFSIMHQDFRYLILLFMSAYLYNKTLRKFIKGATGMTVQDHHRMD